MKTKNLYGFAGIAMLFCMAVMSCVKETLVDPPKVMLSTDWSNRTENIDIPSSYTVFIDNRNLTFRQTSNPLPGLDAGTYPAVIYNDADKITTDGRTATVATTNGIVEPQPGWLFFSAVDVVYENDKENTVIAVMQQQVRQLNFEITITEGNPDDIASFTASLSRVANTMDLETGAYSGTELKVIPVFTQNGNKLTASVRLIGLTTEAQQLTLDIIYRNGQQQQITSDVSSLLTTFETDKHIPITLKTEARLSTTVELGGLQIGAWEVQGELNDDAEIYKDPR